MASLLLINYAMDYEWDYCHVLSDGDLTLKTMDEIDSVFEKYKGYEFIDFAPENYEFAHYKCDYYHLFTNFPQYRNSKFLKICNHGLVHIQMFIGIKRKHKELRHGSGFFSISRNFAEYIAPQMTDIYKEYKCSLASDEVWLQTLCYNSTFLEKVRFFEQPYWGNLRFIDWKRREGNSPHTFTESDFEQLVEFADRSEICFARKFAANSEISNMIYDHVKNKMGAFMTENVFK